MITINEEIDMLKEMNKQLELEINFLQASSPDSSLIRIKKRMISEHNSLIYWLEKVKYVDEARQNIINDMNDNLKDMCDAISEECSGTISSDQISGLCRWFEDFQEENKNIVNSYL